MRKLLLPLLMTLCSVTFAQDSSFVFRNDIRPSFDQAISVAQLKQRQQKESLIILDVRLKEDYDKNPGLIPGAVYVNPEDLPQWSSTLAIDAEVVVYCVAGKWVSQKVAFLLDEQGIRVSSLTGGIQAWNQSEVD